MHTKTKRSNALEQRVPHYSRDEFETNPELHHIIDSLWLEVHISVDRKEAIVSWTVNEIINKIWISDFFIWITC